MEQTQDSPQSASENSFIPLARTLARSRIGQSFVAVLTLFVFGGLAYFAYHHRDFTARMAVFLLVVIGLQKTWNCLPLKRTTRQRWTGKGELWKKHEKMLEDHPAYMWRNLVFLGIINFADQLWNNNFTALPSSRDLVWDASFVAIGIVCTLFCWRAIQRAEMSAV